MEMETICNLLEALMILCFGLSWPISIRKSWISRTAKGKSLFLDRLCVRYHEQVYPVRTESGKRMDFPPCMGLLFPEYYRDYH